MDEKSTQIWKRRKNDVLITSFDQISPLVKETYRAIYPWRTYARKTTVLPIDELPSKYGMNCAGCSTRPRGMFFPSIKRAEILVAENSCLDVLVIIGHEVGHVQRPWFYISNLANYWGEVKAFLFQRHWIDTIEERNIGGYAQEVSLMWEELRANESPSPMQNQAFSMADAIYQLEGGSWSEDRKKLREIYRNEARLSFMGLPEPELSQEELGNILVCNK